MTKLGIPVSPEMAAQFENYMTDEHAILQEMDQAMNELADLAGSKNLTPDQAVQMNQKIVTILLPEQTVTGAPVNVEGQIAAGQNVTDGQTTVAGQIVTGRETAAEEQFAAGQAAQERADTQAVPGQNQETVLEAKIQNSSTNVGSQALGEVLSDQQFSSLGRLLQNTGYGLRFLRFQRT